MLEFVVELLPSWPKSPLPQQYALLSEATAQVWEKPVDICLIVFPASTPVVLTATGMLEFVVELLPSWPLLPLPQQYALLLKDIAQAREPSPLPICLADINSSLFSTPTRTRKLAPTCGKVAAVLPAASGVPGTCVLNDLYNR